MVFAFYFVTILLTFGGLINTYFQQDEWATFGNNIYFNLTGANLGEIIFPVGGLQHFFPLSRLLPKLMADWFGLSYPAWAGLALILHFLIACLVYRLVFLMVKKKTLAFGAGLFFTLHSVAAQPVFWSGAGLGTQAATLFLVLTLIGFYHYLESGKALKWLGVFLGSFLVSLSFKETSIFLFGFLPIWWLIENKKFQFKKIALAFWLLLVMGVFYFGLRLLLMINAPPLHGTVEELSQPTIMTVYLYRLLATPIKVISQIMLPSPLMIKLSDLMMRLGYPQLEIAPGLNNPFIVESIGVDLISFLTAMAVLFLLFRSFNYFRVKRNSVMVKAIAWSMVFIFLASLPLTLIPGKAGYFSLVEGRHLYLINAAAGLLLVLLLDFINQRFKFGKMIVIALVSLGLVYHLGNINQQVKVLNQISKTRKSIVTQITEAYPQLTERVIFYSESDQAYYGLPDGETVLPFQSGFGQTLLVIYHFEGEKLPACFFDPQDDFLFAIAQQGYRQCQGRGFGYFRDFEKLNQALEVNGLTRENVIGFRYSAKDDWLTDITLEVRSQLP